MEPLEQSGRGPFTCRPVEGEGGDPLLDDAGPPNPSTSACRVGRAGLGRVWTSRGPVGRVEEEQQGDRWRDLARLRPAAGKGGAVAGV